MFSFLKKNPKKRLREILGEYQLPSFSKVVLETLRLLRHPQTSAGEICEVLSMDSDLASRVMKTVNSAAYAPRFRIETLDQAITMLGRAELERVLMIVGARSALSASVPDDLDLDLFWKTCSLRAVVAKGIANLIQPAAAGLSFTGGFLQDLAVPLLAQRHQQQYCAVLDESAATGRSLHELEQEKFGWDHAEVGAIVCNEWELPEDLGAAIHHQNDAWSTARPESVHLVRDLVPPLGKEWTEQFVAEVLSNHDVTAEAVRSMLEDCEPKAEELARLLR